MGGLGLFNLNEKKKASLLKWWWVAHHEKNKLWCRIISGKYGENPLLVHPIRLLIETGCSHFIKDLLDIAGDTNIARFFSRDFNWSIQDGKQTSFWMDKWHAEEIFSDRFNSLYVLTKFITCSVREMHANWSVAKDESFVEEIINNRAKRGSKKFEFHCKIDNFHSRR